MTSVRSFSQDYAVSLANAAEDVTILADLFDVPPSYIVQATSLTDQAGVDYLVTVNEGHPVGVDVKRRSDQGRRYWRLGVPEFAVELTTGNRPGPLFRLEPPAADCYVAVFEGSPQYVYRLPTAPLQQAVQTHSDEWASRYGVRTTRTLNQNGGFATTQVVYVPVPVVLAAVAATNVSRVTLTGE